jgi:hypothetical protein
VSLKPLRYVLKALSEASSSSDVRAPRGAAYEVNARLPKARLTCQLEQAVRSVGFIGGLAGEVPNPTTTGRVANSQARGTSSCSVPLH